MATKFAHKFGVGSSLKSINPPLKVWRETLNFAEPPSIGRA